MKPSQRIILNTAATYIRSILAVGLALFSSRWVLHALGQTDFGLYAVVGSVIIFITFFNSVMAGSAARHYAYSIGQGNPAEVNLWFNSVLCSHLFLACVLIPVGWLIGEYAIVHILTIPSIRVNACLWVFRISLVSAFANIISVPFIAMFTAKQHISEMAAWGTLRAILIFCLAWYITRANGDLLLFYTIGMVAILVIVQVAQIFRAMVVFCECRIDHRQWVNKERFKKIFSFSAWTMIGNMGGTLSNQGVAVLLNLFFGPSVNAAYGIANQVSGQTLQLSSAMAGALSPEITASAGRGDHKRMLSLAQQSSKFSFILVSIFAIPLIAEMDYILKLWLKEPPLYTGLFCQLILGAYLIDKLTTGNMLAISAYGKIAGYQATLGIILLLTLPLAWLFLKLGYAPPSVGVAFIITMSACSFGRVLWTRFFFKISIRSWFVFVVFRCGLVLISPVFAAWAIGVLLPPSFTRLSITTVVCILLTLFGSWFFTFDPREREFTRQNMRRLLAKTNFESRNLLKKIFNSSLFVENPMCQDSFRLKKTI